MNRHQSDHLGHVERGTAAEPDHAVGTVRLVRGGAGHHLGTRRIAEHAVEHGDIQAAEMGLELGHHRQRGQRAVGDDQRSLQALFTQVLGDELSRAGTEGDGRGKGETGDGHGGQMISK